jgi:hypothetical protein
MAFLGQLADQLGSQFSISENNNKTLDGADGERYGALGDFASKFDQSAERRYLEEGYLRKDAFNIDSKQFEILMSQPQATVLVKKRMLSSVSDNYDLTYMDKDEKLYFRAMKILFQNKCQQISSLEQLSKIQKIASTLGEVDHQLMSILFTVNDTLVYDKDATEISNYQSVMNRIRRIYAFNNSSDTTRWITDNTNLFKTQYGEGTGVIEITNFTNINTTVATNLGGGRASLTINDPYEAMVITEYDIEKALSDASNLFYSKSIFQISKQDAAKLIDDLTSRLNTYRKSRGASEIAFYINPETLLGRRVTAVITGIGTEIPFEYKFDDIGKNYSELNSGVEIPKEYLINGEIAGYQGLNDQKFKFNNLNLDLNDTSIKKYHKGSFNSESELSLFSSLIEAIYNKLSLEQNSKNTLFQFNDDAKYARRKLRFQFLGKLVIQPMDSIHIYMSSKSQFDDKLLSGLKGMFTGLDFINASANIFSNLSNSINLLTGGNNIEVYAEKAAFVGPEFPSFLWGMIRPQFVTEKEGTHVFGGIVNSAEGTNNAGFFTVDINASDNSGYLDKTKISFKPGINAWSGAIFDPLTPFKTRFDSVSTNFQDDHLELLNENQVILGNKLDYKNPLLKFKSGPNAGKPVNDLNYIHDQFIDTKTNKITKVFHAPDGLIYKWKEGIGAFVQFGSSLELNDANKVGTPTTNADPFAGQDVMNAISLLITGYPYNYATYYRATNGADAITNDKDSNQNASLSFYALLRDDLKKSNALWGNFIPFKNLIMNESSYAGAQIALNSIINNSKNLESKLQELTQLQLDAAISGLTFADDTLQALNKQVNQENQVKVANKLTSLNSEIEGLLKNLRDENKSFFVQNGDDISFDFDEFLDPKTEQGKLASPLTRRSLRRQLNYITRRMSYNVRANEDKNLFIVDDSYDKDYDIRAFTSELESIRLYNNQYMDVKSKVLSAAQVLNLEVFCDTQGHIRARMPQYNRMPSSIFYKMMYQKKTLGIQVFPDFLNNLFENKLSALRDRLEIIEDQIRLDCAFIDKIDDTDAQNFLSGFDNQGTAFKFISDSTGVIANLDTLKAQAMPNAKSSPLFSVIDEQSNNTRDIFSNYQRYNFIKSTIDSISKNLQTKQSTVNGQLINISNFSTRDEKSDAYIQQLVRRIEDKSGQKIGKDSYIFINKENAENFPNIKVNTKYIDLFKITQDLASKLSERHKVIKLFYSTLKNSAEFSSLDNDQSVANDILTSGTYGNNEVPEVFEHMIEDESYDDYGPGSGKRYIIKNSQILRYTIQENPPSHTYVEVQGVLNQYSPGGLPQGLASFPQGGNGMVSAIAIDYDLWRNYGWHEPATVKAPFLSNPEVQCAPYAVSLLNMARKDILRGNVTIIGNEYMQPGEVVYLENRGLLFYVTSVSHNYGEGSNFTTTLNLSYGRAPGEYVPTTSDIIGKLLYNNSQASEFRVERHTSSFNETNIGCIIFDPNSNQPSDNFNNESSINGQSYGPSNSKTILELSQRAAYIVNKNSSIGNNIEASVAIRIYYDGKLGKVNDKLDSFANYIKTILSQFPVDSAVQFKQIGQTKFTPLPAKSISVLAVDISSEKDNRSPSQKAWDFTRNINQKYSSEISSSTAPNDSEQQNSSDTNSPKKIKKERDKLRNALFSYIVDCWIEVKPLPPDQKIKNNG